MERGRAAPYAVYQRESASMGPTRDVPRHYNPPQVHSQVIAMTLSKPILAGAVAVLMISSTAFAQSGDATTPTRQQIRAEMKAEKAANHALAKKVRQAFDKSSDLNDTEIVVFSKARTGKVILAGMIMDPSQDQIAQDIAAKVPGVQSVDSKLSVYEAH
jgi:lipopolysaccharide export LptBFGC system permease protein LptF